MPRFARNDNLFSVVARHDSAEAIPEIATHLSGARNDALHHVVARLALASRSNLGGDRGMEKNRVDPFFTP